MSIGAGEVLGRAERALHARAADLEGVRTRELVELLEPRRDPAAGFFEGVDVHSTGAIEDQADDAAGEDQVVDLEAERRDHRLHHAWMVSSRSGTTLTSSLCAS